MGRQTGQGGDSKIRVDRSDLNRRAGTVDSSSSSSIIREALVSSLLLLLLLWTILLVHVRRHEQAAIVQGQFSIFQQVIERGQNVAFGLFQPVQNQEATVPGGADRCLVGVNRSCRRSSWGIRGSLVVVVVVGIGTAIATGRRSCRSNFLALFQIGIRRVAREGHVFDFAADEGGVRQERLPSIAGRGGRTRQQKVLSQRQIFLEHPTPVTELLRMRMMRIVKVVVVMIQRRQLW
mmetsp:Transcript_19746/g.54367  ORF Transcript_19746/g.54367 Transcript_19746/m.54367 type:complete len:235 (+) Transcript_19746:766-1470(+)